MQKLNNVITNETHKQKCKNTNNNNKMQEQTVTTNALQLSFFSCNCNNTKHDNNKMLTIQEMHCATTVTITNI